MTNKAETIFVLVMMACILAIGAVALVHAKNERANLSAQQVYLK